ncbi:MAG: M81 family metallopeptidase [Spirochaetota bacterium]
MRNSRFAARRPVLRASLALLAGFAALTVALSGCASVNPKSYEEPAEPVHRIAVVHLAQETNSFSPVPTTMADFEASGIHRGEEVLAYAREGGNTLSGFLAAVGDHGEGRVEVVPIIKATSTSGGPIERATYETFREEIVDGVRDAGRLDGIYLALHGAMGVEGMRDPEGDLLAHLREVVGDETPIGVSHDLHANITERRAELATFIVGYKTNPHRDFAETGYRSGEILTRTVLGEIEPVMEVRKMRLLKGGGMNVDFFAPVRSIFREMDRMERDDEVLAVSNFMVHIWLDDPELGWTTIAVTDGNRELASSLADELADLDWEVRDVPHPPALTAREGVEAARRAWLARAFGTVVICDVADAVGAGAPGENAWILEAFQDGAPDLRTYIPVRSASAARSAWAREVGEQVTVTVGAELETVYNTEVAFTGEVLSRHDTERYGKTVVLRDRGIHLIVSERPTNARSPDFFRELGLRPGRADVVVVKNLFPFRFTFLWVNRKTINVMTPGTTSIDVWDLEYERIPRPIYPLDEIDDWRP